MNFGTHETQQRFPTQDVADEAPTVEGRILDKNVSELQEEPVESVALEVLADGQNSELRAPTDREVLNAR